MGLGGSKLPGRPRLARPVVTRGHFNSGAGFSKR